MKVTTESLSKPAEPEYPLTWEEIKDKPGVYIPKGFSEDVRVVIGNAVVPYERPRVFVADGFGFDSCTNVTNDRFKPDPDPFRITLEN